MIKTKVAFWRAGLFSASQAFLKTFQIALIDRIKGKHVFFGMTTLAQPILLWPFFALPILLLVHFGADFFGVNFTKIIFSLLFSSIFLIERKNFFPS